MVFILFPLSSVGFSCENPTEAVEAAARSLGRSKLWNWLFSPPCFSSGVFEIAEASGVRPGTKIIIHLKSDCKDFANESRVQGEDSWAWMGHGSAHKGQEGTQPPTHCHICGKQVPVSPASGVLMAGLYSPCGFEPAGVLSCHEGLGPAPAGQTLLNLGFLGAWGR